MGADDFKLISSATTLIVTGRKTSKPSQRMLVVWVAVRVGQGKGLLSSLLCSHLPSLSSLASPSLSITALFSLLPVSCCSLALPPSSPCFQVARSTSKGIGPVAQWIRHRPTEPGIAGSSPAGVMPARASYCRVGCPLEKTRSPARHFKWSLGWHRAGRNKCFGDDIQENMEN